MAAKSNRVSPLLLFLLLIMMMAGAAFVFKDQLNELKYHPSIPPIGKDIIEQVLILMPSGQQEPLNPPAAPEAQPQAPMTEPPPVEQGANSMANYDLTTDAEGLSKAVATMTLEKGGVVKWRFYSNDAPNTVKRITQLISEGFYNGIVFHRVVPNFVVQAGDPTGTGTSGSGVKLKAEFNQHKHVKGIVSMARTADPNSADSQFFIMIGAAPNLDGQYTVFGKVVEGYENVEAIRQGDRIKSFTIQ